MTTNAAPVSATQTDTEVAVIGAGVAGLAAAAALRRAGRRCVVLEAGSRIGGRAWTTHPAALGGAMLDQGASWLHDSERNPLTPLAASEGALLPDAGRSWRIWMGDRFATEAEQAALDASEARFQAALEARLREGPDGPGGDCSLAEAVDALRDDPWTDTIEAWEGPVIAAAEARALSLRDWHDNLLHGRNAVVRGGIGDFVVRTLGPPAGEVRRDTRVTALRWQEAGGMVRVETDRGTLTARAAIVTVSLGVLAGGGIRFIPALPPETQAALDGLPMGLLSKVALRAAGADRLDLPEPCSVDRRLERPGEPLMVFQFWPRGCDHVIGFIGGDTAWALSRLPDAASEDFARLELRRIFGARADRALAPGAVVTRWGKDALFRGAYAFARPGCAGARLVLQRPLAGGRLAFAGEALHESLAGTVGGAFLSGERAAQSVVVPAGAGP